MDIFLTKIHISLEITKDVFNHNPNDAPGPDGFGASFFQHFWEVIKFDVIAVVT